MGATLALVVVVALGAVVEHPHHEVGMSSARAPNTSFDERGDQCQTTGTLRNTTVNPLKNLTIETILRWVVATIHEVHELPCTRHRYECILSEVDKACFDN